MLSGAEVEKSVRKVMAKSRQGEQLGQNQLEDHTDSSKYSSATARPATFRRSASLAVSLFPQFRHAKYRSVGISNNIVPEAVPETVPGFSRD